MQTQFHHCLLYSPDLRSSIGAANNLRLFYAALFALSLMLGKTCLASTPLPVSAIADRELIFARDAFERRDLRLLTASREKFRSSLIDYPLARYADFWWLIANLANGATFATRHAADFRAFLDSYPDSVLADTLRKEWLRALGKQDQWELFLPEYQRLNIDDADLVCHHWRQRIGVADRAALAEAAAFWRAGRGASDACHAVFEQLRSARMIESDTSWLRVRKLLEDNQLADARRSATLIDNVPATFERMTATIWLDANGYLAKQKLNVKSRASIELFLFALNRVARTDAGKAAAALEKSARDLSTADRGYAWSQIGLYGAMQHDPSAGAWFEKANGSPLTDIQAAWKTRAALRAGEWPAVRAAIEAMSVTERREAAWRYWLARAEAAGGNEPAAAKLRDALARENSFYGLLAAEEAGLVPAPIWKGWKPAPADLEAIGKRPAITRALLLYRLDMKTEGLREWQSAIRDMNDTQLLTAAELARESNVPDRAINTAERTIMLHDFSQRFPMPYRDDLNGHAKAHGLDHAWVYGLIRQESRFMADAKSRVGAAGLMQLMPATAKWAAKKVGMTAYSPKHVADIPVNLALGSFYLRHVLDDLGHPVLATAAYNAGPGRARRWRADTTLEGAIYAESIPFSETRDYVKKVMANAWFYANQAGATNLSLKRMLGSVPGRLDGRAGSSSLVTDLGSMVPVVPLLPLATNTTQ